MEEIRQNQTIQAVCDTILDLRRQKDTLEDHLSTLNQGLEESKKILIDLLNRQDLQSVKGRDGVSFSRETRKTWKMPQGEDRDKFYAFLKERGEFESLVTVNHQTLNSHINGMYAHAIERGEGMEFSIPGLREPQVMEILAVRGKGK